MFGSMDAYAGQGVVKENPGAGAAVRERWLLAGAAACVLAALALAALGARLPAPAARGAPPDTFIAEIAHEYLVNLTKIGPRVAGSYENEVVAVGVLVQAARALAAGAAPHHRVELDVHAASGAFDLSFLDGMNNVYRDVQSVVVRLSARGGRPEPPARRHALLINCHFDTVPDSPGGSDDAAGCAVGLETLRALAAAPAPHAADVILLLNGAEENIMQGSHAFVTRHPWAASARAFVNVEACGAGGREVLFQAGPRAPWLVRAYAAHAPRPFASSLAQDIFESGLIPADTDFRIFRDFGNLSGVDLAWSANGYVYHTALDTAQRAPPAALQRTGDNVLALAKGLLAGGRLARGAGSEEGEQPVFFDVLGLGVVCVGAGAARALVALLVAAVALRLHLHAKDASAKLYMPQRAWWWLVARGLGGLALAALGGVAAAAALGGALHAAGARLAFYRSPWLLGPLYAAPAVGVCWLLTLRLLGAGRGAGRGGGAARRAGDAAAAGWAGALLACAALGLRSGFLPALWAAAAAAGAAGARALPAPAELGAHAAAAALPALLTGSAALDALAVLVPVMGRAGDIPHDVVMGGAAGALALATSSWLLPLVLAARARRPAAALLALAALTALLVLATPLGAPYSETRPMRLMVFHTRRTDHARNTTETFFWTPDLHANSPHALDPYVPAFREAQPTPEEDCARWVYCGAPYYLPALGFIPRGHRTPAPAPPLTALHATLRMENRTLVIRARGPAHVVLVVSPAAGARLARFAAAGAGGGAPREARPWAARARRTYFFTLHDARRPAPWDVRLDFQLDEGAAEPAYWADVSLAGHSLFGPEKEAPALRALLAALPPHAAPAATGWGVDLHLYRV